MQRSTRLVGLRSKTRSDNLTKLLVGAVLVILFLLPLHSSARGTGDSARPKLRTGDLYALVVGVSKFRDVRIPGLDLAAKDARSFGKFLESQNKVFKETKVTYLIDEKATKAEVEKQLYYTLPKAGKNDTIILFFSGHGAYDPLRPKDFLFLAHDSEPDYLGTTAVKMSGLEFLKGIEADRVLIIADACHAGGFSQMKPKAPSPSLELFLQEIGNSSGKAIITSGKGEQLSWEMPNLEHSVFTHNLIEGLKGEADRDHDGVVTLNEVYRYAYGKTKDDTSGRQHPQFEGKVVGAFPLSHVGPPVPLSELRRRIIKAASDGKAKIIKRFLHSGTTIHARDERNNSPLILSSRHGHAAAVKLLLENEADLEATNNSGNTALLAAAENGRAQVAKLLLLAGAKIGVRNREGFTPLAAACSYGHTDAAETLLKWGEQVEARNKKGQTALILASANGHVPAVKLLLENGAETKCRDLDGATALISAARRGHRKVVKLLLKAHAGISDKRGYFLNNQLLLTVLRGHLGRVTELLNRGADVNARAESGDTPLILATGLGDVKLSSLLIEKGADVHARITTGVTPLTLAAALGRSPMAKLLLAAGANPRATDANTNNPLMIAAANGRAKTVEILCGTPGVLDLKNEEGQTALMFAAASNHATAVNVLLKAGADTNVRDRNGDTALMVSARQDHRDAVKALLAKGTNINAKNRKGRTALMLAVGNGNAATAKLLVKGGADLAVADWEGKTAHIIASEQGQRDLAKLVHR